MEKQAYDNCASPVFLLMLGITSSASCVAAMDSEEVKFASGRTCSAGPVAGLKSFTSAWRCIVLRIRNVLLVCAALLCVLSPKAAHAGTFAWPVDSPNSMSNSYGTYNAVDNNQKYHTGFDLTSSTGSRVVRAAAAGRARVIPQTTFINNNHNMGNVVIIDHNEGRGPFTLYAHLASFSISDGQSVVKGQQIAVMGNTGCGTTCGIHLHFEVKHWGVLGSLDDDLGPHWGYTPTFPNVWGYINPWPYLDYDLPYYSGTPVYSVANQSVLTGPDPAQYTKVIATVQAQQQFSAFARYGDWYQVYLPSNDGPASGWIRATYTPGTAWRINDSIRGLIGVRVRSSPSTSSAQLSSVWDRQWVVERERAAVGNGCTAQWYRVDLASNSSGSSGWICGSLLSSQ